MLFWESLMSKVNEIKKIAKMIMTRLNFTKSYKNFRNWLYYCYRSKINTGMNMITFINKIKNKQS